MNSPIKLPPRPPMDVGISSQVKFAYSQEALDAYAEQAVREALADLVAVAWMDEFGNVELSYKPWMDDEPGIVWRPLAIIPENNHE